MNEWEEFREILEQSVERNGEKLLTNKWLLNIVKMVDRKIERVEEISDIHINLYDVF